MKNNSKSMLRSTLLILAVTLSLHAFAGDDNAPASNMDILRDKVIADKKFVVADNMKLTESEAKAFAYLRRVSAGYARDRRTLGEGDQRLFPGLSQGRSARLNGK
ncbi:MAG: hypothetical protein ABJA60_01655 [Nitrosospira sp.]